MERFFANFREASQFAAEFCRENQCGAELKRTESGWLVSAEHGPSASPPAKPKAWLPYDEWMRQENESELQAELERERIAAAYAAQIRAAEEKAWPEHKAQQEARKAELSRRKGTILMSARAKTLTFERVSLVLDNYLLYGFTPDEVTELKDLQQSLAAAPTALCRSCHSDLRHCLCGVPF